MSLEIGHVIAHHDWFYNTKTGGKPGSLNELSFLRDCTTFFLKRRLHCNKMKSLQLLRWLYGFHVK